MPDSHEDNYRESVDQQAHLEAAFNSVFDAKTVSASNDHQRNLDDISVVDAAQDVGLKRQVYNWVSNLVIIQIIFSDLIFVGYLSGVSVGYFDFSADIFKWWIGGTVVETLGLALVIVKYLFRSKG